MIEELLGNLLDVVYQRLDLRWSSSQMRRVEFHRFFLKNDDCTVLMNRKLIIIFILNSLNFICISIFYDKIRLIMANIHSLFLFETALSIILRCYKPITAS